MARKISQFSEYEWDKDTFADAYIPIIAPLESENNVVVVNEEDIEGNYINYKFKPINLFLTKYDSYETNSLIVTDNSGKITFKTGFSWDKVLLSKEQGLIEESSITTEELNCLSGVTSNIQDQLNDIKSDILAQLDTKLPKIFSGDGAKNKVVVTDSSKNIVTSLNISTDELECLDNIESNIQDQLKTKAAIISPKFSGTPTAPTPELGTSSDRIATTKFVDDLITNRKPNISAANRVIISNSENNITTSGITTTELSYLSGLTSNIKDQLNNKLGVALTGETDNSKVLVTNSSKKIGTSTVTADELKCLSGLKSKIIDLLKDKLAKNLGESNANKVLVTKSDGSIATSDILKALDDFDTDAGTVQKQINDKVSKTSSWGMPNYAERVKLSTGTFVIPVDSIGYARSLHAQRSDVTVTVDGAVVFWIGAGSSSSTSAGGQFLIPAGSIVTISGDLQEAYYAPLKKS